MLCQMLLPGLGRRRWVLSVEAFDSVECCVGCLVVLDCVEPELKTAFSFLGSRRLQDGIVIDFDLVLIISDNYIVHPCKNC